MVDAGVAEGNFALRYIDIAEKDFLFEPEERWLEVIRHTFYPYRDKTVIIPKKLGRNNNGNETTLDEIIGQGKCDFIKMDIEGAEPDALLGAMDVLRRNDVKLSICSYHRQFDKKYIEFILESLGYKTSTTSGYMFFMYDDYIDETLDFRRGVVFGEKR